MTNRVKSLTREKGLKWMPLRLLANDNLKFSLCCKSPYSYVSYPTYTYGRSLFSPYRESVGPVLTKTGIFQCFVPKISFSIEEMEIPTVNIYDDSVINPLEEVENWISHCPAFISKQFYTRSTEKLRVGKIYVDVNRNVEGITDGSQEHPFRFFASAMDAAIIWSGIIHLIGIDTICVHVKGTVTETPYASSFINKETAFPIIIEGEEDKLTFNFSSYYNNKVIFPFYPIIFKDCKFSLSNLVSNYHVLCRTRQEGSRKPYTSQRNIMTIDDIGKSLVLLSRGRFSPVNTPITIYDSFNLLNRLDADNRNILQAVGYVYVKSNGICHSVSLPVRSRIFLGLYTMSRNHALTKAYNSTGNKTYESDSTCFVTQDGKIYIRDFPFYFKAPSQYKIRNIAFVRENVLPGTLWNCILEAVFTHNPNPIYTKEDEFICSYVFDSDIKIRHHKGENIYEQLVLFNSSCEIYDCSGFYNGPQPIFSYQSSVNVVSEYFNSEYLSIIAIESNNVKVDIPENSHLKAYFISCSGMTFDMDINATILDCEDMTFNVRFGNGIYSYNSSLSVNANGQWVYLHIFSSTISIDNSYIGPASELSESNVKIKNSEIHNEWRRFDDPTFGYCTVELENTRLDYGFTALSTTITGYGHYSIREFYFRISNCDIDYTAICHRPVDNEPMLNIYISSNDNRGEINVQFADGYKPEYVKVQNDSPELTINIPE